MRVKRLVGIAIGSMLCISVSAYAQDQAPLPGSSEAPPTVAPEAGTGAVLQDGGTTSSSSSSYYRRGVGVKDANVFAPKYKQRLQNWREQLSLGLERGFLKTEDGERFKLQLDHLTTLEADVAAKGYAKPELDAMEQEFNTFNVDFTRAMQPKVEPTPPATPTATPPVTAPPAVAPVKPAAAKPVAKTAAKKTVVKKTVAKKTVSSTKKRRR